MIEVTYHPFVFDIILKLADKARNIKKENTRTEKQET